MIRSISKVDQDRLCMIEKEDGVKVWNERELLLLLDHYNRPTCGSVRIIKDVELLRKEAKEKVNFLVYKVCSF